jgi:Transcriptional regulator
MQNIVNPSVTRSKNLLTGALLRLMQKKPYSDITVSELIGTAELARKTYYRHFKSKDEILLNYIETLFEQYFSALSAEPVFTEKTTVRLFFEFLKTHIDFFILLLDNHLELFVLDVYEKYLYIIDKDYQHSGLENNEYYYFAVAFSAGGFWRIACHWARNGAKESPQEIAEMF